MTVTLLDPPYAERSPWFASWFDSIHYHKLYAYRDEIEAAGFIDGLISRLRPESGATMLDLGCGAGRHSKYLASKGFRVTGIDLAAGSILEAKRFEGPWLHFFQHDMRLPFATNAMDYVFSFFTSFGYFEDPAEHLTVVRNMAESLKTGGCLVLDYLNVACAEARMMPREVRIIDGFTYRITRWSDTSRFFKRIVIEDPDGHEGGNYVEQVAKFGVEDFNQMFSPYGLCLDEVYGDYRLTSYDAETSPRMILVARKTAHGFESGVRTRRTGALA